MNVAPVEAVKAHETYVQREISPVWGGRAEPSPAVEQHSNEADLVGTVNHEYDAFERHRTNSLIS